MPPAYLVLDPRTRRDVLDLVRAVLWADGELADRELGLARGAAVALGLVLPADGTAFSPARGPSPLRPGAFSQAGLRERMLAYAVAAFTALADGRVDAREAAYLVSLRARLGLSESAVSLLTGHARWALSTRSPAEPWHRTFDRLVLEGARRVDSVLAHQRRAA